jgi:uncharacterized damage-inducible protein DinB
MRGRPDSSETAPYYFTYIDKAPGDDILPLLHAQLDETLALLAGISEEKSLYRYAPEKWSIRQVVNHVNDTERAFVFRALWFARGFDTPLPGYDQIVAAAGAQADEFSWASHLEDFRAVRQATLTLYRSLPAAAWMRKGIASGNPFTVRSLAFIIAGHVAHHLAVLRERY